MALERHEIAEFSEINNFIQEVQQRLFCSVFQTNLTILEKYPINHLVETWSFYSLINICLILR